MRIVAFQPSHIAAARAMWEQCDGVGLSRVHRMQQFLDERLQSGP